MGHFMSKCFLIQIVFSLGKKYTIGKISLAIEATNSILFLEVKWRYHANSLLKVTARTTRGVKLTLTAYVPINTQIKTIHKQTDEQIYKVRL